MRRPSIGDVQEVVGGWFVCHHRSNAFLHARSLQTWITTALREAAFVNGDQTDDLSAIMAEVARSKALLLVLTEGCLLRPWVLLEAFWACVHDVPLVPLFVEGGGYDYATARQTLGTLRACLDEHSPGAVEVIDAALVPHGFDFSDVATRLHATIPHLISLPYSPHDSTNHMLALIADIVERVRRAREQAATVAKTAPLFLNTRPRQIPKPQTIPKPQVPQTIPEQTGTAPAASHSKPTDEQQPTAPQPTATAEARAWSEDADEGFLGLGWFTNKVQGHVNLVKV